MIQGNLITCFVPVFPPWCRCNKSLPHKAVVRIKLKEKNACKKFSTMPHSTHKRQLLILIKCRKCKKLNMNSYYFYVMWLWTFLFFILFSLSNFWNEHVSYILQKKNYTPHTYESRFPHPMRWNISVHFVKYLIPNPYYFVKKIKVHFSIKMIVSQESLMFKVYSWWGCFCV